MSRPTTYVSAPPGRIELETQTEVRHSCEDAWSVITDYDHLGAFMPNMSSRQVGAKKTAVLVEQTAHSSILPLLRFQLLLEFIRETPECLRFRRMQGSLSRFDGFWRVTRQPSGCHIYYQLNVAHGFPLPSFLLASAVRVDVERMMPAIIAELERRRRDGQAYRR
jgi:ribosome-associated toxin RatA of RatAB toxin-antitoxin module